MRRVMKFVVADLFSLFLLAILILTVVAMELTVDAYCKST